MALDVHVAGPGLDVTRRILPGEPALIIGRDGDCAIPLPDPERNVSRRHLSVWNDADQLHFHVLSVVNGVTVGAGELPPGARGVLAEGDTLAFSTFVVRALPVPVEQPPQPHPEFMDTWARLQQHAEQLPPEPGSEGADDDPFGEWGFSSTFGAGAPQRAVNAYAMVAATDLQPFFTGLGLDPTLQSGFTRGELEMIGRLTRIALQGLVQAGEAAAATRQEARAEDHTMAEKRELNPLRMDTPLEIKLYYLFGGEAAAMGFMPPDRAVAQLVTDLASHEQAVGPAVQELVRSVLAEFDPEALKKRLLGSGGRLFESARAWDAYARDYAERTGAEVSWVQQLLERHFARAYAKALLRAKRNTSARPAAP